jgi:hypothetical protein
MLPVGGLQLNRRVMMRMTQMVVVWEGHVLVLLQVYPWPLLDVAFLRRGGVHQYFSWCVIPAVSHVCPALY